MSRRPQRGPYSQRPPREEPKPLPDLGAQVSLPPVEEPPDPPTDTEAGESDPAEEHDDVDDQ